MKKKTKVFIASEGKIISDEIACPTCGKKVDFLNDQEVLCNHCHNKKGRLWNIKELVKTLRRISGNDLVFKLN